jgi:hypothetical protein
MQKRSSSMLTLATAGGRSVDGINNKNLNIPERSHLIDSSYSRTNIPKYCNRKFWMAVPSAGAVANGAFAGTHGSPHCREYRKKEYNQSCFESENISNALHTDHCTELIFVGLSMYVIDFIIIKTFFLCNRL